ncbi:hypothetical protein JCM10908_005468 [Rhodotorula pacifica]|uniref:Pex19p n=1 Tax=Rhodotorula pacifica TaxID=1495444 RepID=UPI0031822D9A
MPPPKIHDADEDDLDDLDDVLDSLTTTTATQPTASTSTGPQPPASKPPPPPTSATTTTSAADFPDPDDDAIPDPDDIDLNDPDLARELEQGMKALLAGLGGDGAAGVGDGLAGIPGLDDPEFAKIMQEMLKGDFGAAAGAGAASTGAGAGAGANPGAGDEELQKLMAALGMSADDLDLPLEEGGGASPAASTSSTTNAARPRPANSSSLKPTTSSSSSTAPPANFQDAIAASMSKLRDSSTTADASRAASSTGAGGGGDSAGMAAMLAQLAGMPGGAGGLGGLEGLDSDEGLQGMLDDMMKQLMSREMLYEPLKELADKYPAYLSTHGASLSSTDRERYEKQRVIVCEIVAAFEEPGADVNPATKLAPEEELKRAARTERVVELVAKMNECGAPPTEIMGEMPPGMELGPDGAPKVPECCIC